MATRRIDTFYGIDLVSPKRYPHNFILVSGINIDRIALDPEIPPMQFYFVTGIESVDQPAKEVIPFQTAADFHLNRIAMKIFGISDTIKARYRRHDNNIFTT